MEHLDTELYKLASDATAEVERLEGENANLRAELSKLASQAKAPSGQAIDKAVESLVKSGALKEEQGELTKQAFKQDPDAALRAIAGILNAQPQMKTASQHSNIAGGRLSGSGQGAQKQYSDLPDRLMTILNK